MALSVEGQVVTLWLDCMPAATLPLARGLRPVVSTEGITVFGARLMDEEVFQVWSLGRGEGVCVPLFMGMQERPCAMCVNACASM